MLHETVRDTAEVRGDATALSMGDERLSYAELEQRASRFAHALLELGCRRGDRVCLFVPKSPTAVVAMLGTLKAGCVYVPIDLSSPAPRLAKVIAAAEPAVVALTSPAVSVLEQLVEDGAIRDVAFAALDETPAERFGKSVSAAEIAGLSSVSPNGSGSRDDPAHILFTSGSTGTPKGVVISHGNVAAFLEWAIPYFELGPDDRISGHAPLHFDLSTFDVYGALFAGCELHLVPPELSVMPRDLAALIEREELTQWFSVPSVLSYMANFDTVPRDGFPSLRRVIWCGDVLPTPVLIHWMERVRHPQYTNLYGPTEATIASAYYTIGAPPAHETDPIPIGQACGGEEILVLDENLEPTAVGTVGDLYIAGSGLAAGYWRDAERTSAAFIPDPRSGDGGRLYRTGDRARVDADGLVYFLGRQDSQIKHRGHRVELGEVEAAVNTVDGVREAAVVGLASSDLEGTSICCAFDPEEAATTSADVRTALRALLPPYMVPTRWLVLSPLPTNANGKIDRKRLRELFLEAR